MCHWIGSLSQRGLCLTPILRLLDPTSATSLWVYNQCVYTHTHTGNPTPRHPSPKYYSTILLSDYHVCSILAIQRQASPTFYRPLYVCANANVSIRKSLIGPPKQPLKAQLTGLLNTHLLFTTPLVDLFFWPSAAVWLVRLLYAYYVYHGVRQTRKRTTALGQPVALSGSGTNDIM